MTVLFVLLAESLIFPPSAANFRNNWMRDRVQAAEIAALALEAAPEREVSDQLAKRLMEQTQLLAAAIVQDGMRELIFAPPAEWAGDTIMADLRGETRWSAIADTFGNAFAPEGRYLRIVENSSMTPDSTVEVIVPEAALKKDLWEFSRNIFFLSLLISALTGGLIYLALYRLVVRPVMKMTRAVVLFRDNPDMIAPFEPSGRQDEIGQAECALRDMQEVVSASFRQRRRLAELGEAVAKGSSLATRL